MPTIPLPSIDFIHAAGSTIFPTNNVSGFNEDANIDIDGVEEEYEDGDADEQAETRSEDSNNNSGDVTLNAQLLQYHNYNLALQSASAIDVMDIADDDLDSSVGGNEHETQQSVGNGATAGNSTPAHSVANSVMDTPTDNQMYHKIRLVPSLTGTYPSPDCCHNIGHKHSGQCRIYYDPLGDMWVTWWTCCGVGYEHEQ
jgi:hypothetical protein